MEGKKKEDYLAQLNSGVDKTTQEQIAELEKNLELHLKSAEWKKREVEAKKELFALLSSKPKPLQLKHEYEEDERFWELNKILLDINHERELAAEENTLSGFNKVVEIKREELERLKGELK